jgi:4-amino-4-deoxy-L-arabinose transferase-like glycosyltransferase
MDTNVPRETFYFERGDSTGYVLMADSILQGDTSLVTNDEATRSLRTPGYPLFLAGIFSLTREPFVIVIMQILIALCTIPFIYSIGRRLTNGSVSFFATLAYILYPTIAFLNTQILAETLFMLFTTLSLWLLFVVTPTWSPRYLAAGAAAGVAILIRPSFMYVVPLLVAYIVISEHTLWRKLISGTIVAIATIAILAPWLNANQRDFGQTTLSTAGNFNILYVYIPQFLAQKSESEEGWLSIQQKFITQTREAGYEIGSHRASEYERQQIKAELSGKIVSYVIFHLERSILTFVSSGIKMVNNEFTELGKPIFSATPWLVQQVYTHGFSWELIKNNFLAFFDAALMALFAVLTPIGIAVAIWRRDKMIWGLLLILGMILVSVLLAGPNGNARYRMPIQPYIFLLAFSSIYIIYQQIKNRCSWFLK